MDLGNIPDIVTTLGAIVGGGWALYLVVVKRSLETGIGIRVQALTHHLDDGRYLVSIETLLKNVGHRRIRIRSALSPQEIADYQHSVTYPADLQVRRIPTNVPAAGLVDYWSLSNAIPPVSLLHEYETLAGTIDFFMEPGEDCVVGLALMLEPGHYLTKVVIIGDRTASSEYWSRIVHFAVPGSTSASDSQSMPDSQGAESD